MMLVLGNGSYEAISLSEADRDDSFVSLHLPCTNIMVLSSTSLVTSSQSHVHGDIYHGPAFIATYIEGELSGSIRLLRSRPLDKRHPSLGH